MARNDLSIEAIAPRLAEKNGNIAAVARYFGVSRGTIHNRIRRSVALQDVLHNARETMRDIAEASLYAAVERGEPWAVCFFLKTQAKDRGYSERRQSNSNQDQTPIHLIPTQEIRAEYRRRFSAERIGTGIGGQ